MNDDAVFEAGIRAMLERRDPGAAPAHLGDAVIERMRRERERSRLTARSRRLVNAVAGLAAAIVLSVIVLGRPFELGSSPGASPAPSILPTLVAGDGVTATVGPPLLHLVVAAGIVIGLGVLAARATRRIVGYAAVTAILGMIWVGSMIWASDALGDGGGTFGVDPHLERPAGFARGNFVRAEGDVEFRILVGVVNQSQLPLNLLGVAPDARGLPSPERLPRIVGLGYLPYEDCCLPSHARPFSRMALGPGESVQLVVLGRAGRCASSTVEAGAMLIESIPLVYEQLTLLHTAEVVLPEHVAIVNDGVC
jgi:hypothetical protein